MDWFSAICCPGCSPYSYLAMADHSSTLLDLLILAGPILSLRVVISLERRQRGLTDTSRLVFSKPLWFIDHLTNFPRIPTTVIELLCFLSLRIILYNSSRGFNPLQDFASFIKIRYSVFLQLIRAFHIHFQFGEGRPSSSSSPIHIILKLEMQQI